jgi:hypothetical protein
MRNGLQWTLLSTVLLGAWSLELARADAKLLGFDEPNRIPDTYIVILSESLPWHRKLTDGPVHSEDPEVDKANAAARNEALQADAQLVDAIAKELASAYHGVLRGQFHAALRGFSVKMSEQDAREMAKDARIESISTDMPTALAW